MNEELTVFLRPGCSLCEAMVAELAPLAREHRFRVGQVDVDSSPELVARYGERVPVLVGAEGELCHFFLDPEAVRRYFAGR